MIFFCYIANFWLINNVLSLIIVCILFNNNIKGDQKKHYKHNPYEIFHWSIGTDMNVLKHLVSDQKENNWYRSSLMTGVDSKWNLIPWLYHRNSLFDTLELKGLITFLLKVYSFHILRYLNDVFFKLCTFWIFFYYEWMILLLCEIVDSVAVQNQSLIY